MNLIGKKVKVISGYYEENEGVVTGVTLDGYWLVQMSCKNSFFASTKELAIIRD